MYVTFFSIMVYHRVFYYSTLCFIVRPFFFKLFYFIYWTHSMWDLSSPTRDRTHAPSIGSSEFNHWTTRESPSFSVIIPKSVSLTFTFLLSSRPKYSNIQRTHLLKNFTSSPMLLFLLHHQSSLPS